MTDDERQLGADANRAQDEVGESRWSALVLPVSEADALAARRRLAHDPSMRVGRGAHVTLHFPFLPAAQIHGGVLARLDEHLGHAGSGCTACTVGVAAAFDSWGTAGRTAHGASGPCWRGADRRP